MLTMRDVIVEKMRREEKRQWAEYGRFVHYATNRKISRSKRFGIMTGRLLIRWGGNMQTRCAARCGRTPVWRKAYTHL